MHLYFLKVQQKYSMLKLIPNVSPDCYGYHSMLAKYVSPFQQVSLYF